MDSHRLKTEIVWEEIFRRLIAYKARHGNCNVPQKYSDQQLGAWVHTQRIAKKRGKLLPERERRLTEAAFVWDLLDAAWEEMFRRLVAYKAQHGNCDIPRTYSDKVLANWVTRQRQAKKRGELSPERERRLSDIGFVWATRDAAWEEMFRRLVSYRTLRGNCNVPHNYSDQQLGSWVSTQRVATKRGKLSRERGRRLTDIGFVWDLLAAWEEMFRRLVAYKDQYGNCDVPRNYSEKVLANWVSNQCQFKKRGKLSRERERCLTDIGFIWDPHEASWEAIFRRLVAYKAQHGNCNVPQRYSDQQLGAWVNTQRKAKKRGKLLPERERRLTEVAFVWRSPSFRRGRRGQHS